MEVVVVVLVGSVVMPVVVVLMVVMLVVTVLMVVSVCHMRFRLLLRSRRPSRGRSEVSCCYLNYNDISR